jgi:hypothetical protein
MAEDCDAKVVRQDKDGLVWQCATCADATATTKLDERPACFRKIIDDVFGEPEDV